MCSMQDVCGTTRRSDHVFKEHFLPPPLLPSLAFLFARSIQGQGNGRSGASSTQEQLPIYVARSRSGYSSALCYYLPSSVGIRSGAGYRTTPIRQRKQYRNHIAGLIALRAARSQEHALSSVSALVCYSRGGICSVVDATFLPG